MNDFLEYKAAFDEHNSIMHRRDDRREEGYDYTTFDERHYTVKPTETRRRHGNIKRSDLTNLTNKRAADRAVANTVKNSKQAKIDRYLEYTYDIDPTWRKAYGTIHPMNLPGAAYQYSFDIQNALIDYLDQKGTHDDVTNAIHKFVNTVKKLNLYNDVSGGDNKYRNRR